MIEIKSEKRGNKLLLFASMPIKNEKGKVVGQMIGEPVKFSVMPVTGTPLKSSDAIIELPVENARRLFTQILNDLKD